MTNVDCYTDGAESGEWDNAGNNIYTIIIDGDTINVTVEFTGNDVKFNVGQNYRVFTKQ